MSWSRRRARAVATLAVAGLAVLPLTGLAAITGASAGSAACPAGTVARTETPGEQAFERRVEAEAKAAAGQPSDAAAEPVSAGEMKVVCRPIRAAKPESFAELSAMQRERNVISAGPQGYTPPGAVRAALVDKSRLTANAASVPGAQGAFAPLGTTPLIADDANAPEVNGLGLADQAGRVDSLTYDEVNNRLFAAPGTGGVWVSTDRGGSWTSVGDTLPYQAVGSVAWSPAGAAADGTLLVLSGEASAGGSVYTGMGAFYSTDTGRTWNQSTGIPDGLMGFKIKVDPTDPQKIYAATSQGLYRSTDAGRTYVNVALPTGTCGGKTAYNDICQNANWVTDVEIKAPGGVGTNSTAGQVIAAVGYRAGQRPYPGTTTPQSPKNGLYRSDTGDPGSFTYLSTIYATSDASPTGFAVQNRVGRTELGAAIGPNQNHGFLYAIVEDAVLFNGGVPAIDAADPTTIDGPLPGNTSLNGIYVSSDFGTSWTKMADRLQLQSPATGSALIGTAQAVSLYAPGIQSWYNMWIKPDPTSATTTGVPDRLVFGLEEVWQSREVGGRRPQDGSTRALEPFQVIGPYFSGSTCAFLSSPLPVCPTTNTRPIDLTTHPDQQDGLWLPDGNGGVSLVVGNDGGVYTQSVAKGAALVNNKWGRGNQQGFHTLLPYDAQPAKDGTVWFGLQDNGSGKIQPDGKQIETFGGDGFFAAVDPDNSAVSYSETTLADMRVTTDGGKTYTTIPPPVANPMFSNPFVMDPTDANHLLTAGPEVVERTTGPTGSWVQVFNLDTGNTGAKRQMTAVQLQGAAAYVGFCSTCDIINKDPAKGQVFASGLATNVGGTAAPAKGKADGWHLAAANGLPDRYVTSIAVDPADPKTVFVTLSGYANRQWWPPGAFNDANPNRGAGHVFKSTDAGENFTDITGLLPDVPARSIEINRGQLLVGTDVGMFLSNNTDGGTWAALAGLPNVPVVSIANHPGNPDQVVLATFGRGVYNYTFGSRPGVLQPQSPTPGPPDGGSGPLTQGRLLANTGLPAELAAVGLLALFGGLLVRRRSGSR